jgi:hypothetical protein
MADKAIRRCFCLLKKALPLLLVGLFADVWMALAIASLGSATAGDLGSGMRNETSPVSSKSEDRLDGSTGSRVIPISADNGQVIVDVTINGRGPFPMMFDTGGVEAITPDTATALGLLVEGEGTVRGSGEPILSTALTHLKSLRLGNAQLSDIALPVIRCRTLSPTAGIACHSLVLSGLVF